MAKVTLKDSGALVESEKLNPDGTRKQVFVPNVGGGFTSGEIIDGGLLLSSQQSGGQRNEKFMRQVPGLSDLLGFESSPVQTQPATQPAQQNIGGLSPFAPPGTMHTADRPPDGSVWMYDQSGKRVAVPQTPPTGTLDTPPPQTGLDTALNDALMKALNSGIFNSDVGRESIDSSAKKLEAQKQTALKQEELERRRQQQIARYEDIFGRREQETRETQAQQRGTESALQFRLGLGGTPYAAEETRIKEAQRQSQLDNLASEKSYLIQQAENAFTDADFELADQLTTQIQDIEDKEREIDRQSRQDEIQNYQLLLQGLQESRAQAGFNQEQASTQLENLIASGVTPESVPDTDKQSIEQALGLPQGGFESYYQTYQEAQEALAVGDDIKLQQSLISLLNDVPPDQTVTIGGVDYAGLQDENPNVLTYDKVVGNTKTKVAVDKGTGEVLWEQPMGQAYKSSGDRETPEPVIKITDDDKRTLAGAGFTAQEIDQVASDVEQFGIDSVLEGVESQEQKNAIRKVYGSETEETNLTRQSLSGLYGIPDNNDKTKGILGIQWGETNSEKLDNLMSTIQKYRDVGYSDKEILKLIQE